jgi:hypothetical protein
MRDRLNFFEPWERPANHENQLTRALLVVLRYCPIAHQVWLSLVDEASPSPLDPSLPRLALHTLPHATFDTQRAQILENQHQPKTNEPIKGISVLCAADAPSEVAQGAVLESDRGQVLDGIIRYGDYSGGNIVAYPLIIVFESKLEESPDDRQARNINFYGQPIQFDGPVRRISWRHVLGSFTDLVDEKRSVVSGAEREILSDFLTFVEKHFPQLGPYNTLERCAGESFRVGRRLDAILSKVLGTDGATLPGVHTSVKLARLEHDSERRLIKLRMWPADTLEQARAFYARPKAIERVLKLQNDGWSVSPNFHFGFMATGYCWTRTTMSVADYMWHWLERIGDVGQIERRGWDQYWRNLVNEKIADPRDRERFDHDFTNTQRASATPRPGIACTFDWRFDEAARLDDDRGQLTNAVIMRVNQLLEALGEDRINSN